jgi:hypothetical protein
MAKDHTPPETKVNHKLALKPRQVKPSAKLNQRHQLPANKQNEEQQGVGKAG